MFANNSLSALKSFGFAIGILVIALVGVILLQATTRNGSSQDIRSHAGTTESILKEWDFTKGDLGGWTGNGTTVSIVPVSAKNTTPYLAVSFTSTGTSVINSSAPRLVNIMGLYTAPVGMKKLKIWM